MPLCIGITAIRDDSSSHLRSLSNNEKSFVISSILNLRLRCDGRELDETRSLILTLHRSDGIAECTIQIGQTKVLAVVSCELISPQNLDRPNEGSIQIKVDLSPMACMGFFVGGGQDQSQRIHRIFERILRERVSGALDTEALCVLSGVAVWKLHVTITALDDDGNLVDGALISSLAALRHLRLPETQVVSEGRVEVFSDEERDPIPLPLHHTPIPVSFALFTSYDSNHLECIIDPNQREEILCHGLLTFCFNKHEELCCIDFSAGICPLTSSKLKRCAALAQSKVKELSEILEKTLEAADQNCIENRLQRIHGKLNSLSLQAPLNPPNVPYWEDMKGIEIEMEQGQIDNMAKHQEQAYRLKALDFEHLHEAAAVKDDDKRTEKNAVTCKHSSSLLQAMIHSVTTEKNDTSIVNSSPSIAVLDVSKNTNNILENSPISNTSFKKPAEEDSDDEEDVVMLQNEFTPVTNTLTTNQSSHMNKDDDINVNDIIKSLKKSKKKSKKGRKKI